MFPNEATWFYENIMRINPAELFPMLNLGSSTKYFRTVMQPYINKSLFQPLEEHGRTVIHCDVKDGEGVDLIGDITSIAFVEKLKEFDFQSIICSHLLEHIVSPSSIAHAIEQILPIGGYLFVSCPYSYPYHPDPIDTMFRPLPEELASCFSKMEVVATGIVSGGRYGDTSRSIKGRLMEAIRLAIPFYKYNRWLWHFREVSSSCVVLKKH